MLSAIILAKNEEENIGPCIKCMQFCAEILVIDDNSTDKTKEIAEKLGARVITNKLSGNFGKQRNYGLAMSMGDWILFVDADERISRKLGEEIKAVTNRKNKYTVYKLKRRDYFLGRELLFGEIRKARTKGIIRLMKKNSGKWKGCVHEEFITDSPASRLNGFIDHYPHRSVASFIAKINSYSSLRAKELAAKKEKYYLFTIIFYPSAKFIYTYFLKLGFLDGMRGFIYSFMMSFHSFLTRSKLYVETKSD